MPEALVFPRGRIPQCLLSGNGNAVQEGIKVPDQEVNQRQNNGCGGRAFESHMDTFTWRDVVYDIKIKGEPRRLLDHVSGWVKPGTLTALMGASGAGKTTLLDVLSQRTTVGVIHWDILMNGRTCGGSFQRKTGYVQQQGAYFIYRGLMRI
jgi:ABC-type transport system involved in cytochrome bd biosynthesis fused ATPase/permease subunit